MIKNIEVARKITKNTFFFKKTRRGSGGRRAPCVLANGNLAFLVFCLSTGILPIFLCINVI